MCDSSCLCLHCLHFALSEPYQPGGLFDRRLVTGLRFRLQSHRLVSCHTSMIDLLQKYKCMCAQLYMCMCAFGVKSVLLHISHLKMPPMIIFPGIYAWLFVSTYNIHKHICAVHIVHLCVNIHITYLWTFGAVSVTLVGSLSLNWYPAHIFLDRNHLHNILEHVSVSRCFENQKVSHLANVQRCFFSKQSGGAY